MKENTPLSRLASAICGKNIYSLFQNQTIMYQVIVIFASNKLPASCRYSCTDELIPHIRNYMNEMYNSQLSRNYSQLHQSICQTIVPSRDCDGDSEFNNSFGCNLTYLDLNGTNIRTNVNKVINNSRSLPHSLINECRKTMIIQM